MNAQKAPRRIEPLDLHSSAMHRTLVLSTLDASSHPDVTARIYPLSRAVHWWRNEPCATALSGADAVVVRDRSNHPQLKLGRAYLLLDEAEVSRVQAWLSQVYA